MTMLAGPKKKFAAQSKFLKSAMARSAKYEQEQRLKEEESKDYVSPPQPQPKDPFSR
jgi:hypothetical protein